MPRKVKLYQELAALQTAYYNNLRKLEAATISDEDYAKCTEWADKHQNRVNELCRAYLPHGGGIDDGPRLFLLEELEEDQAIPHDKLNIGDANYLHRNDNGDYDGWTYHRVIVTPSLQFGFHLKITGRNRNGIKEYLREVFYHALNKTIMLNDDGSHHEVQD